MFYLSKLCDTILVYERIEESGGVFMNKPWYLWPCIFIYRIVLFVIKLPIYFIKYFSLGFFFTAIFSLDVVLTLVLNFIKYFVYGFIRISMLFYKGLKKTVCFIIPSRKSKKNEVSHDKVVIIPSNIDINTFKQNISNDIENNNILYDQNINNNYQQLNQNINKKNICVENTKNQNYIEQDIVSQNELDNNYIEEFNDNNYIEENMMPVEELENNYTGQDMISVEELENNYTGQDMISVEELENNYTGQDMISVEELEQNRIYTDIINNSDYDNNTIYENNSTLVIKAKPKFLGITFIFKPFIWLTYGFLYECYILYKTFKSLFIGILSPFIFTYYGISLLIFKIKQSIEKNKDIQDKKYLEEIKRNEQINQNNEDNNINNEEENITSNEISEEENDIIPEVEREVYVNENVIGKKPLADKINDMFIVLGKLPENVAKAIHNWYHNIPIVKNLDNQKSLASEALLLKFDGEDAEKSEKKIVYEYRAKNPLGKIVTDYFEAHSKVEVHSFLLSEGYEVYNIRTSKYIQFLHGSSTINRSKFKTKDLIFFLTQLSTYLKAGMPLVESLKILGRQYDKKKHYQKTIRKMIYDLTMGESFSTALEKQGDTFPKLLINMVQASELTGELPETLDQMADYFTETHKTKQQMITALTYPSIVLVLAIGVLAFMMIYIVPKFVSIYDAMDNVQIPQITRVILNISNFLESNLVWLAIGIAIFFAIFIYLYKNIKAFRTVIQLFIMKIPIVKSVVIYNEVTMFTQTLGTLLSHNVFITDSMEILNKITNNEIYKMIILDTINNIAKGEKISKAFEHWAFPIPAYEMIVTGEKTGQLPEMMQKVGAYYQELHRNTVTRVKTLIEPFLIVTLTFLVGIIVLSIIIPMFNMYSAIQG